MRCQIFGRLKQVWAWPLPSQPMAFASTSCLWSQCPWSPPSLIRSAVVHFLPSQPFFQQKILEFYSVYGVSRMFDFTAGDTPAGGDIPAGGDTPAGCRSKLLAGIHR